MKWILRFFLFSFLGALLLGAWFWLVFPDESLAFVKYARKRVLRVLYPAKPFNSYQTFKVKLPSTFGIHGIDVSAYQGEINWEAVKAMKVKTDSISFVFIKATEGLRYFDKYFQQNWQGTKKVGLLRGAYHYFQPHKSGEEQAKYFIQHVYIEAGDLPPVLDIEEVRETPLPTLRKELKIFLKILEEQYGVKPIIYTNKNFYEAHLGKEFNAYPLWVAQYKNLKTPQIKRKDWHFWQHSCEGTVNGINVPVDLNVFESDREDLNALRKR